MKKKQTLIKLPNGNWANPEYVTAIELCGSATGPRTKVWAVMDSGYGTGTIYDVHGDHRDQLANLICG